MTRRTSSPSRNASITCKWVHASLNLAESVITHRWDFWLYPHWKGAAVKLQRTRGHSLTFGRVHLCWHACRWLPCNVANARAGHNGLHRTGTRRAEGLKPKRGKRPLWDSWEAPEALFIFHFAEVKALIPCLNFDTPERPLHTRVRRSICFWPRGGMAWNRQNKRKTQGTSTGSSVSPGPSLSGPCCPITPWVSIVLLQLGRGLNEAGKEGGKPATVSIIPPFPPAKSRRSKRQRWWRQQEARHQPSLCLFCKAVGKLQQKLPQEESTVIWLKY